MTGANDAAVVITTFNHARFLGEAIDSALAQTVAPAEIVVVDDGSTDHPELIVERYPGVRLIRQANQGLAAARNTGWRATTTSFVVFLDADDWLRPNALEIGLRQLNANPAAAFNYGAYANRYWPSGRVVDLPFRPVPPDAFGAMLHINPVGMHATVLYRRDALQAAGGFAEELRACEDYDLYLRLADSHRVACCSQTLADYRQHDSNMSRDPAFMLRAALRAMRRIAPRARARGRMRDWNAGTDEWKAHYVDQWISQVKETGPIPRALRQLAILTALAPAHVFAKAASGAAGRLRRQR